DLFLKDSHPYGLYKKFFRSVPEEKYTPCCRSYKYNFYKNQEFYELCKRYENNFKELSTIMNGELDSNEQCIFLKFWLNEEIRKLFKSTGTISLNEIFILSAFFSVSNMLNSGLTENRCIYNYSGRINMELWKKWKDLYDYIRNKDNLQDVIDSSKQLCDVYPKYYRYIEGIYNNYKEVCCDKKNGNCPNELYFKEWCTPGKVLTKLACNNHAENSGSSAERAQDLEEKSKGDREEEKSETVGGGKDLLTAEGGGNTKVPLTKDGIVLPAVGSHVTMLDTAAHEDHADSENSDEVSTHTISNPTGTVIGTSLGFVLPLITIYRFTPLGSWINTKLFRKNILMENMKKNERELLLNSSEIREMNLDHTRYNIMYNSAHNE
ncbi:variable surface protein Vir22, truncated, putative, partial [Plasmodium vivax]